MKNLRCPFWALACLAGLTGCANLQERMATRSAGTAASVPPPPPPVSLGAPAPEKLDLGELPPPAAPEMAITQPPPLSKNVSDAAPAKASPSRSSSKTTVKADQLYNLGSSKPARKVASSTPQKNSTLSRLASKAAPAKLDINEEAPAPAREETPVVSAEAAPANAPEPVAPKTVAADPDALPAPTKSAGPASAPAADSDADTSFLATPVRKGEGAKERSPQSNLAPQKSRDNSKPTNASIVPVSNPADDMDDFDGSSYS